MLHFARWKIILVLIVSIGGILAALPNLLSPKALDALPGWIPHKQVNRSEEHTSELQSH